MTEQDGRRDALVVQPARQVVVGEEPVSLVGANDATQLDNDLVYVVGEVAEDTQRVAYVETFNTAKGAPVACMRMLRSAFTASYS